MSFGVELQIAIFLISWCSLVLLTSIALVRNAEKKLPPEKLKSKSGFIYSLPIFVLLGWLVYSLCLALVNERIRRPCRTCDIDTYWYMYNAGSGFWVYFGFIYFLAAFVGILLVTSVILFFKFK
jgi:hypothetical protein